MYLFFSPFTLLFVALDAHIIWERASTNATAVGAALAVYNSGMRNICNTIKAGES
jgi:hypothetical protein